MARSYRTGETRLVSEWVALTFPGAEIHFRVRLGAIDHSLDDAQLTEAELRALGVNRRFADALAITPREVHLIEGKLRGQPGALEQLDLYARLFPLTPEFRAFKGYPVRRHLVWAVPDPVIASMARERGIEVHVFFPVWLEEHFGSARLRDRVATRPGGLLDLPSE